MSGKRRSAGPIRQLSLQHPPSTATRRLLKKQQSMDAERLWTAGNSINGDLALRVTASSFRNSDHFPQDIVNTPKTPAGKNSFKLLNIFILYIAQYIRINRYTAYSMYKELNLNSTRLG
ncbi:hypothetical protein C0J52_20682 [Blattella germanica]|nr:hypothetical protein C0J52_20682 [Blattella germanica]